MTNPEADAGRPISRVLVVDDEPAVADLLRRLLQREGYSVDGFSDGQEALNALSTIRPHIVLLDVSMPGLSGIEVCHRIKQNPTHRLTPIIMVTGLTGRDVRLEGLEAGADDFLSKPVDPQELIIRVPGVTAVPGMCIGSALPFPATAAYHGATPRGTVAL